LTPLCGDLAHRLAKIGIIGSERFSHTFACLGVRSALFRRHFGTLDTRRLNENGRIFPTVSPVTPWQEPSENPAGDGQQSLIRHWRIINMTKRVVVSRL
jgi:hypothetical protein